MIRNQAETTCAKKLIPLLLSMMLALGCIGVGLSGCSSANTSAAQNSSAQSNAEQTSASSIAQQLKDIEGVVSVESYQNDSIKKYGLDQTYETYEITFEQPIDHNDTSAGTFKQRVRLFYSAADAVNIVNTDGYMLTDLPTTAYRQFCNQTFNERYGTPNIIQIEYRYFGESTPEGLDLEGTALWDKLTVEQAATDFHEIVQKLSSALTGKRLWTGTSKGGFATDYQCYFQEQHGYNDADAFAAFCAPFCNGRNDERFFNAVDSDIGYKPCGEQQAKEWHELLDRFQIACIKHREQLQAKYYQQALEEGDKFRSSYFGTDETTQAERLWEVAVNEYPVMFWQYLQDSQIEVITKALDEDNPDEIYNCIAQIEPPSSFAYNSGFLPYEIQSATEMGNCAESFDHLRQLVANAKETAPEDEKAAFYLSTEGNPLNLDIYLTEEQSNALPYNASVRNAMTEWLNSTSTAHLVMISGQSDPWYFVGPISEFSSNQIKSFEATCNHKTLVTDLSEQDQDAFWQTLDSWLTETK